MIPYLHAKQRPKTPDLIGWQDPCRRDNGKIGVVTNAERYGGTSNAAPREAWLGIPAQVLRTAIDCNSEVIERAV
jgi:hypothetical protein